MRIGVLLTCCALAAVAQTPNQLTKEERAAGWRLLFDGKSLKGWSAVGKDAWTVEDGAIKSLSGAALREDLISNDTFTNFEMTFEWKVAPGSNSGVKYKIQDSVLIDPAQLPNPKMRFEDQVAYEMKNRTARRDKVKAGTDAQVYPVAFEYQVIDNDKHSDALHNVKSRAGALYRMVRPSQEPVKPVGEFNQARIVLRGRHVEHWLNGVKVVDTDLDTAEIRASIEERWKPGHPVRELLENMPKQNCPVALQHHSDVAWFRSIKIRPLP